MSIAEKTLQLKKDFDDVYEAGKQKQYDEFWDIYQNNGKRTDYGYAFSGVGWTDDAYNPKYAITPATISPIFQGTSITNTKVDIVVDLSSNHLTRTYEGLYGAMTIVTIKNLVLNCDIVCGSTTFRNMTALKNIKITGEGKILTSTTFQTSTKLTKESMKSIIDALSDSATGQTLTLSKTAVKSEFGINTNISTEDDIPIDNELYEKIISKPNWSFSFA